MWREKLKLNPGESFREASSRAKGSLGQKEIDNYDVIDSAGKVVGSVTYTEETSIKAPFKTSYGLVQRAASGSTLVDERR
jgi:hypothetical protein